MSLMTPTVQPQSSEYVLHIRHITTFIMTSLLAYCEKDEISVADVVVDVQDEFMRFLYASSEFGHYFEPSFLMDVIDGQPVTNELYQYILNGVHNEFTKLIARSIGSIRPEDLQVPNWISPESLAIEIAPASGPNPTVDMSMHDQNWTTYS